MYQFARDATVAEQWLLGQEPYLTSAELGVSFYLLIFEFLFLIFILFYLFFIFSIFYLFIYFFLEPSPKFRHTWMLFFCHVIHTHLNVIR